MKRKYLINSLDTFTAPVLRPGLFFIIPASLLLFLLFSCTSLRTGDISEHFPSEVTWKQIAPGISEYSFSNQEQRIEYHAVRILLNTPGLAVKCIPQEPGWQKAQSVKAFACKENAVIAINTAPFRQKQKYLPFSKVAPVGLIMNSGKTVSAPDPRYCALVLSRTDSGHFAASIIDSQTDTMPEKAEYAFGGFWTILRNREIRKFRQIRDVRTAAGTAENGNVLILMTGKNFTYEECAQIFIALGADTAMQFDGGSSSSLVVKGRNTLKQMHIRKTAAAAGFYIIQD